jgi:hypothetical protein
MERDQGDVAWSPDSRWLVTDSVDRGDLMLVRIDGSDIHPLTNARRLVQCLARLAAASRLKDGGLDKASGAGQRPGGPTSASAAGGLSTLHLEARPPRMIAAYMRGSRSLTANDASSLFGTGPPS